jgi:hypothetical protein
LAAEVARLVRGKPSVGPEKQRRHAGGERICQAALVSLEHEAQLVEAVTGTIRAYSRERGEQRRQNLSRQHLANEAWDGTLRELRNDG